MCTVCTQTHARCKVCRSYKDVRAENWCAEKVRNAARKKTVLVCRSCASEGYTEKDATPHTCRACGEVKGRRKFNEQTVHNALKDSSRILICIDCADREQDILKKLKVTSGPKRALLCTCKCPLHTEKCAVYRGWPGYNVGVTVGDLQFLKFRPGTAKRYNLQHV